VATLCRKIAKDVLATGKKDDKILVTAKAGAQAARPARFRYGKTEERDEIGLVRAGLDRGGRRAAADRGDAAGPARAS